jgi:hypothetical protein
MRFEDDLHRPNATKQQRETEEDPQRNHGNAQLNPKM